METRPHHDHQAHTLDLFARRDDCLTDSERDALEAALVELNLGLADSIANRYSGRGVERDDLLQVARLGLVKAVRRFHADRGVAFSSFAIPTITGEVKRYFRDHGWAVRPPRRLQELHARVAVAGRELEQRLHRSPTPAELAAALDIDAGELVRAREAASGFRALSFDAGPAGTGGRDEPSLMEQLLPVVDGALDLAEDRVALSAAITHLTPREQRVVELRFSLDLTQAEIARELGVSQMQVSRIISSILTRLRDLLAPPSEPTAA